MKKILTILSLIFTLSMMHAQMNKPNITSIQFLNPATANMCDFSRMDLEATLDDYTCTPSFIVCNFHYKDCQGVLLAPPSMGAVGNWNPLKQVYEFNLPISNPVGMASAHQIHVTIELDDIDPSCYWMPWDWDQSGGSAFHW